MINVIIAPAEGIPGRVSVPHSIATSEVRHRIKSLGFRPSNHDEINKGHAKNTPELLVAIGSTVDHPQRKHTQAPAFVAFKKDGQKVHILDLNTLMTNFEVAIMMPT